MDAVTQATRIRVHHPRRHAAVRTGEYIFSQLIPYIGNKRKLLHLIADAVQSTGCRRGTFADLFAGSTVVARWAKKQGFRVIANDWEPYSHEIGRGTVVLNSPPPFRELGGVARVFETLNSLPPLHGYVATHLCPENDEHPDPDRERMFFTRANGERIDAIRERLAMWEDRALISRDERAYALAALVYATSYASNTSGVFKGFHRGWGGRTRTALYRILAPLVLTPPVLHDNHQENLAFCEDACGLAAHLSEIAGTLPDVAYIDPPYNQHPYGSNYHVLNTVCLWDKPALNPSIRVNGKTHEKSGIRKDWRSARRSAFNAAREALPAFEQLLDAIRSRWVLVSYSTDGNMPLEGMLQALAQRGGLRVVTAPYKRYRVSAPRMSLKSHNIEFVAALDQHARSSRPQVDRILSHIFAHERMAVTSG